MAVLLAALGKGLGVGMVFERRICVPGLPVHRDALALQVAQVGGNGVALHALELDDPRLYDDAAGPEAHASAPVGARFEVPAAVAFERCGSLATPAARVESTAGLAFSPRTQQVSRVTALLGDRTKYQSTGRARRFSNSVPRFPESWFETSRFVFRHAIELAAC